MATRGDAELESLQREHILLIQDNALLRAELTRLRDAPRHLAHARQKAADAASGRVRAEKICEVLKSELKEAVTAPS